MNPFLFREAVASVALSHPEDHDCDVCRAAKGDYEAAQRVAVLLLAADAPESAEEQA